jgi:hypothetical protein
MTEYIVGGAAAIISASPMSTFNSFSNSMVSYPPRTSRATPRLPVSDEAKSEHIDAERTNEALNSARLDSTNNHKFSRLRPQRRSFRLLSTTTRIDRKRCVPVFNCKKSSFHKDVDKLLPPIVPVTYHHNQVTVRKGIISSFSEQSLYEPTEGDINAMAAYMGVEDVVSDKEVKHILRMACTVPLPTRLAALSLFQRYFSLHYQISHLYLWFYPNQCLLNGFNFV